MAKKQSKSRPNRSKPYEQKVAEKASAKRAAQVGRGQREWTRQEPDTGKPPRPGNESQ